MKLVQITLPTPLPVGNVNVYLIKENPITLIDVGPKTEEAIQVLEKGLAKEGIRFSDIRRLVLTHSHEDHCGLAKFLLRKAKDLEIFIHEWETGHLFGRFDKTENEQMLRRLGIPASMVEKMKSFYSKIRTLTETLEADSVKALRDEDEIEFDNGIMKILHTPGHTPGSCSFFREADRTLICGDCVLKRITPNPILSLDPFDSEKRFPSLAEQLVSVSRLRSLSPTLTYCGHGDPIYDFEEVFNRYLRLTNERQQKVVQLVPEIGATAFEIACKLFPEAISQEAQKFLAISETVAHLDYAVMNGKLAVEFRNDGVEFYRKV
ncbi:MAG: MBL fold metallo-hydrolase [Pyrinomonadaceae bacterium]|nr:MBL fold metallo-hydrolase [Pyrinomonadaceae bacterium]MCX7640603.1 MBL fold metallo-hydrolase [Pyrinomonadaceae bacterium]MDW8303816.1 MBL fold metallo-hydrolase [Acidobacteriota bacterium]